jgi:DNA polymerase
MQRLSLDLETYASVDLAKAGVYRYAEADDFEILLIGYSVDGGEVQVVDLSAGEELPPEILDALTDDDVIKTAFNAAFERICLSRYLSDLGLSLDPFADNHFSSEYLGLARYLNPASWRCSMVWSAYMGLPLSLEGSGSALGLEKQKMTEGKELIRYFCKPCKPNASNGGRLRNLPEHAPEKWALFKAYNKRDVETEMAIQDRLAKFPVPDSVWDEYRLDQEINDRGVLVDMDFVRRAIECDGRSRAELTKSMKRLTNLDNPNSVQQMKTWLSDNGLETDTLGKKQVAELIKTAPEPLAQALGLRQALAKSSVRKYQTMEACVCNDGRVRGMFQFYGASRTGRFSGKLIQLQNCPANHMPDLRQVRELVKSGNFAALEMLYDSVPEVLSELIRTAFIPAPGMKFIVADFSAIEARVISWLAKEQWKLDVFAGDGKVYEATAARMFHVPIESVKKGSPLRQKAKQAELACIAEGQMVLTDKRLVPIEAVTLEHRLWDGLSWVRHDGVVYKGEGEVIEYGGLTATKDHLVWVEGQPQPVQFGFAAARGLRLIETSGKPTASLESPQVKHPGKARIYDIQNAGRYHRFTVSGKLVHNCGYGGSVGALKAMGALEMGLQEDELQGLVNAWRAANPNIVKLWWDVDRAVTKAVRDKTTTEAHGIRFSYQSAMLFITLPSGRKLSYVKPRIGTNKFGSNCITYMGTGATKKWERIESYGPKFVENIVQAISRDILCYAMRTFEHCSVVMHIHDELVMEAEPNMSLEVVCEQMGRTPPWAEGLILRADGYVCDFYQKD